MKPFRPVRFVVFSFLIILIISFASCNDSFNSYLNQAPIAEFEVTPESGTTSTNFNFDASSSSDAETSSSELQVRWDWNNDGSWDTNYSTKKVTAYQYAQEGTYTVKIEVKDEGDLVDTNTKTISVTSGSTGSDSTFIDFRDDNSYTYTTIGTQTWMTENLAYLPGVSPSSEGSESKEYYYVYDYHGSSVKDAMATNNYSTYGVLYNYEAAINACPPGWHLPSGEEWKTLEKHLGMSSLDANKDGWRDSGDVGKKLKSTTGWNDGGNGINSEGFNALPGGYRDYFGAFGGFGDIAAFWTSSPNQSSFAWYRYLQNIRDGVLRYSSYRSQGFSVRCVKD